LAFSNTESCKREIIQALCAADSEKFERILHEATHEKELKVGRHKSIGVLSICEIHAVIGGISDLTISDT
jgi:hypothetical protein